ncbi:inactive peptidyl-prolyl cis-trans isomerase fkbp6 [Anaeramoeba flamelloides]|uniref:peptidylprolyl isomerase n=1 Tax=Anaeramoeba flamelloides TaxID=1746091 RepID=A0ABQ8XKR1_9EUKA|nr:inactive peptidyl-prolyl cis-trans isomerase fkbp6 [Anaeramoeba flamelloides]
MSQEIIQLHNNQIQKKIIKEGNGEFPTKLSTVVIKYEATTLDGKLFDSTRFRKGNFKFQVGFHRVIEGLEIGILTMKQNEISIFTIAPDLAYGAEHVGTVVEPNTTVVFEIELLSIDKTNDLESKFNLLNDTKSEGNTLFKEGQYDPAIVKYEKCLELMKLFPRTVLTEEEKEKIFEAKKTNLSNISMALIKLKKYQISLKYCEEVLKTDPENEKAIYRKGICIGEEGDFKKAIEILTNAYNLNPKNNSFKIKIKYFQKRIKKDQERRKQMQKNLLKKK